MIKILVIPSSDYLGHPIPSRTHHIFERLNDDQIEVHVARFNLYKNINIKSNTIIHNLRGGKTSSLLMYYLLNFFNHGQDIIKIIKREKIDIIVASNLSPLLSYLFFKINSKHSIPIIFDVFDYFPTVAVGSYTNKDKIFGRILENIIKKIFDYLICKSDAITVPSKVLFQYIKENGKSEVVYIPNGVDEIFFKKYNGDEIREQFNFKPNDVIVGYIGSTEFWLDMEPLFKGMKIAKKNNIPVKLLILGKSIFSAYTNNILKWINNYQIKDDVIWLDFVPFFEVPKYISAIDLGVIPFKTSEPTAYFSNPNKMWEYFAQHKPVLSTPIPEVLNIKDTVHIVNTAYDYYDAFYNYYFFPEKFSPMAKIGYKLSRTKTWSNQASIMREYIYSFL